MNTKLLRQKVLDLAIHGKLVPQNPAHEPASKLLERIRGESLPLATAGKPSSATPSAGSNAARNACSNPISEDEIPFEIPENWCWTRIKDISSEILYGVSESAKEIGKYKLLRITDIQNDSVNWNSVPFTDFPEDKVEKYLLQNNDILFARTGGTVGKSYLVENLNGSAIYASYLIRIRVSQLLNPKYIKYFFGSITYWNQITINSSGIGQPNVNGTSLGNLIIPLPPLEEQKLIVEEIERIFALIDTVEQNKTDLETVIKQTKSKILDLAIHGKLVPQDKADEPASKMLEKLRAEKEEKIANGQLKRDKNDSYIYKSVDGKWLERKADGSEEEIEVPFEIPESWSWCRLPEVCSMPIKDGTHQTPTYSNKENGIPFLSSKDVTSGKIDWNNIKYITKELHEELYKRIAPQINDILLAKNGTTGISALVEDDIIFDIYVTLAVLRPTQGLILPKYLLNIVNSPFCKNQFNSHLTGIGVPNLHLTDINKTIIPLPPLEEQIRVVLKIEEIFSLVNRLGEEK